MRMREDKGGCGQGRMRARTWENIEKWEGMRMMRDGQSLGKTKRHNKMQEEGGSEDKGDEGQERTRKGTMRIREDEGGQERGQRVRASVSTAIK